MASSLVVRCNGFVRKIALDPNGTSTLKCVLNQQLRALSTTGLKKEPSLPSQQTVCESGESIYEGKPLGALNVNGKTTGNWVDSNLDSGDNPFMHPYYKINRSENVSYAPLPLPPHRGMSVPVHDDQDIRKGYIQEPTFDPKVHLNLRMPEYVRLLSTFEKAPYTPDIADSMNRGEQGTDFAYTSPFSLLSEEGVKAINDIIKRESHRAPDTSASRGNKKIIRGLYYTSKFIRDLQNCRELRDFFKKICGEELVPHPSYSNSPQVNISYEGGTKGPVDHWHWDSVAYTGVILLSDMSKMVGGDLEIAKCDKKKALDMLAHGQQPPVETVRYGQAGKMILAQGSEILHHVTPVESQSQRISMIFGYAPANPFQPQKTVLDTMRKLDSRHQLGDYEYFREKCWQIRNCLDHYVNTVEYSTDGQSMGEKLRAAATEMNYYADILQDVRSDRFKVLDEMSGKLTEGFNKLDGASESKSHEH